MVEELATRPATVDCRSGARTSSHAGTVQDYWWKPCLREATQAAHAGLILAAGAGERGRRVLNAIDSTTPPSATVRHRALSAS
jgi:hypothetical protein